MAAPYTPGTAARTPLSTLSNNNKSQSFGTVGKPAVAATPAPQSAEANNPKGSASRKSLGAVPSSAIAAPSSIMLNKRLSVMPPQTLAPYGAPALTPAATPNLSRLSIVPTPGATNQNRKSLGIGMQAPPPATPKDPRRSSVFNAGGPARGSRKDPRPVGDKAYLKKQIQRIIEFLLNNNWNSAIAPQKMQSPSIGEYASWVLFTYRIVDPNFSFEGKFEDEIPALFRTLRYPFPLSKSSIQSIGAPHAVPTFIAALEWLCDSVTFIQLQTSKEIDNNSIGEAPEEDVIFPFCAQSYALFLQGSEQYQDIDKEMTRTLRERMAYLRENLAEARRENDALLEEVKALNQEGAKLPMLEKKKANQQQDILKFQKHVVDLENYTKNVNAKFDEAKREHAARESERNFLREERSTFQQTVKLQEMNNVDGERLQKERAELEEAQKAILAAKDAAEKISWETEMGLAKQLADLEANIKSYNGIAHRLALTPVTAKRAHGKSFEIPFNSAKAHINEHIINQIRNEIIPALADLKATITAKLVSAREVNLSLKESLGTTEDNITEKEEEVAALERSVAKTEEACNADKDALNEKLVMLAQDTQALAAETAKLRGTLSSAIARAQKSSEALQADYDALVKRQTDEKEAFNNYVLSAIQVMMNHKSYITEALDTLRTYFESQHKELIKGQ